MNQRSSLQAFTAGLLLLAAACSDQNEPIAPNTQPESSSFQPSIQGSTDDPISLARGIPGFGGAYVDDRGTPVVYLKNAAERGNAERALTPFLRVQGIAASQLRVLPAKYDWAQLERWFTQASTEVLAVPGGVFVDADEASNRVTIGVKRGASARIRGVVARLGIPQDAVVVQETEPIRLTATLRGKVRPAVGGLQINFPRFPASCARWASTRSGTARGPLSPPPTAPIIKGAWKQLRYWQPTPDHGSSEDRHRGERPGLFPE